ncbi:MAG: hypothetical protein JWM90_25 [Thermoleophilia bacterium]|nr:hypothetical protein [Thermoleophilia bacterium]
MTTVRSYDLDTLDQERENPRQSEGFRVELDGIEPTTSCLQSTRSPN